LTEASIGASLLGIISLIVGIAFQMIRVVVKVARAAGNKGAENLG